MTWEQRMAARAAVRAHAQRLADQRAAEVAEAHAHAIAAFRHYLVLRRLQAEGVDYCRDCWAIQHDGYPGAPEWWAGYRQHGWVHVGADHIVDEVRHELDEWRDQPVPVCRHACHGPVGYVLPAPVAYA